MKAFLLRVVPFLAIHAVALAALGHFYAEHWRGDDQYLAAWGDKYERLVSTRPPRILLAGGSSVAFGFDSPAIEQALARPVVNVGLHAAVGREMVLREIEETVGPGDVVVLSFEYVQLFHPFVGDEIFELLVQNPEAVRFLEAGSTRELLDNGLPFLARLPKALVAWLRNQPHPKPPSYYSRSAFNAWGDAVAHHGRSLGRPLVGDLSLRGYTADGLRRGMRRLDRFADHCRAKGATVTLFFPAIPADELDSLRRAFTEIEAAIRAGTHLEILNSPLEMGYPRDLFFHTTYHLTKAGSARRTALLVERLRPIVAPEDRVR